MYRGIDTASRSAADEEKKQQILNALDKAPLKVAVFCDTWVRQPENMVSETAYKQALLELESAGKIEVLSKDGKEAMPASKRRSYKGKATLGPDYFVRLCRLQGSAE